MNTFLRELIKEAIRRKTVRKDAGADKPLFELPNRAKGPPTTVRENDSCRELLGVPEFVFLQHRELFVKPTFLPNAVARSRSSTAPDIPYPNALSQPVWRWNTNNPIANEIDGIQRFFAVEKKLTERALKKSAQERIARSKRMALRKAMAEERKKKEAAAKAAANAS